MSKEPKEVERLLEAIAAFEAIDDDAECTRVVSQALKDWPELHSRLRALRQARVQSLREQKLSWAQIAEIIGGEITPERAQQIGKGLSGATRKKAKREAEAAAEKPAE